MLFPSSLRAKSKFTRHRADGLGRPSTHLLILRRANRLRVRRNCAFSRACNFAPCDVDGCRRLSLSLSFSLSFSNRFDGGGGEVAAIKGHGNEGTDATVSRPVMKSRTPSERGFSLPLSDPRDREMALQLFLFPRGIICSCLIDAFLKKGK